MKEDNENKRADFAIWVIFTFCMLCLCWGVSSCKTRYIPVVEQHTNDSTRTSVAVDTVYVRTSDSVVVQLPCSDSIEVAYVDRWHTQTEYKVRERRDTIRTERVDSIPYVQEVPGPEVVRNSRFAGFCIWYFVLTVLAAAGLLGLKVYKKLR